MILIIDNYDSFVWNLAHLIGRERPDFCVAKNDQLTCERIHELKPTHIVLSPGPMGPKDSGICLQIIDQFSGKIPILGVCLGHQAIAHAYGLKVTKATRPWHATRFEITHHGSGIFSDIPSPMQVVRYHSLLVDPENNETLNIDAQTTEGEVMAISHPTAPTFGVQFHPESIIAESGAKLIQNFLKL